MEAGDLLVLASDGILDSENSSEEPYGQGRLAAAVASIDATSAGEVLDRILDDVKRHTGSARFGDDQTILVLTAK